MISRPALVPALTAAIVLVLATVLSFAGCGLPLQGIASFEDAGTPCAADSQCNDSNPCTADTCKDGACEHITQADGPAPLVAQVANDCQVLMCSKGLPDQQNDDQDIQADAEACTIDECNDGKAFHTVKLDGASCTMGGIGHCEDGKCQIICTEDSQCQDSNECTQDSCDISTGLCIFFKLNGESPPNTAQIPGDCKVQVCVNGVNTNSRDDSDLPTTATECDKELCDDNGASNPLLDADFPCAGGTKRCDSKGACVECYQPSQCGADSECIKFACSIDGVCSSTKAPLNTPLAAQTPGDCHTFVCDGEGNIAALPIVDNNDTSSDNNDCTSDICTNGVSSNPALPPGSTCGNGQKCNAVAQCGCSVDGQCNAPNTCGGGNPGTPFTCGCTKKDCTTQGKTCGTVSDTCSAMLNCNSGTKNGTETDVDCGGIASANATCGNTCAQGKKCSDNSDCTSNFCADGVCCDKACNGLCEACSAARKGSGSDGTCGNIPINQPDVSQPTTCASPSACDGNKGCKSINGQTCATNTDCVSGSCADGVCCNSVCNGTCMACSAAAKGGGQDGVCGNIAINLPDTLAAAQCTGMMSCDGNGVCKNNVGQPCANNTQCVNATCVDSVCCGVASCPACQSCALGGNGTCGNVPAGPDNVTPNTCMGMSSCDGMGNCKKSNGQACATTLECLTGTCVDGVCCGVASCPACQSCAVPGNGTCGDIPAGPDSITPNTCIGFNSCDGAGNCKKIDGQTCAAMTECLSGNCVDGVCCGVASCPACQSCALSSNGTCGNITSGMPDIVAPNTCMGMSTCDGSGKCKKLNGQTCALTSECLTGTCVDSVCCGVASCLACQSCALSSDGTCGNIANGMPDTAAPNTCMGTSTCDGAGSCKKLNGTACGATSECLTGNCVDGVCCGVASCPDCQSCAAGANGTCGFITSGMPDNVPVNTCAGTSVCDGVGGCKKLNGTTCTVMAECLSGQCADGVCCNVACDSTAICMSCNGATSGTCSPVKNADDADSCNASSRTCDAMGACLLKMGQLCTAANPTVCASGVCTAGSTCQ